MSTIPVFLFLLNLLVPLLWSLSLSLPLSYLLSLMLQSHSLDTFNIYLWSTLGWLCEVCYTVDFLPLSHIYSYRVLFHTPSYFSYACFSAPLLQEILWFCLGKLSSWAYTCRKIKSSEHSTSLKSACLSLLALSASLSFFLALRFSVFQRVTMSFEKSPPQLHRSPSCPFFLPTHTLQNIIFIARISCRIFQKSFGALTCLMKNLVMTYIIRVMYESVILILILIPYVSSLLCHCHTNDC